VHCATGYPAVTGGGSVRHPVNQVLPAWDMACAYQAALAIAAALHQRGCTGEGAELKLALSDVAFTTLSHLGVLAEAELLQQDRPSLGNHIYGAFGRDFGTADGGRLMVAAISINQWKALVAACGIAEGVAALEARTGLDCRDEVQRFEAREAIAALLEPWFAARTRAEAEAVLEAHKACWGRYATPTGLLAQDPRVSDANPVFERITTPGIGAHLSAGAAVRATGVERTPTAPAPLLGTHTDEVLHGVLGLDGAAVGRLHDAGVVAGPERDPTA
jgi:2-methylfumaryl-CoA isomerase